MEPYGFSIDIAVSRPLTEAEKNQLMVALSDATESVLGPAKGGTVLVYTPRTEE